MLCLGRKVGERIIIGDGASKVTMTVVEIDRNKVRLGFDADRSVEILREELVDQAPKPPPTITVEGEIQTMTVHRLPPKTRRERDEIEALYQDEGIGG